MNKKVALCANGWNAENLENFISGLNDGFENYNVDIFVFTSYATYSQSLTMRRAEHSIYGMPDYSTFDATIIFGSGMNSDDSVNLILQRCKDADVPVIMQGYDSENVSSVTVNNYTGMRALCDHLIEVHNVKDVIFIGGPEDNHDSNLRIKALREALEAHGHTLDDEKIIYANWERTIVNEYIIEEYKNNGKKLPDAIICANDPMALFALMSLESIGVKVPDDVIVTGFDNLNDGRLYFPSVASVDQCYREQGVECARFALEMMENKHQIKKKVIHCTAIPGESCGCSNCKNEAEVRKMLGHDALYKKFIDENLRGREAHLEMCIMSSDEYEDIPERIRSDLFATTGEEGDDFHIYINPQYKTLEYMDSKAAEYDGKYYSPLMDVLASKTGGEINYDRSLDPKKLFLGYKGEGKGKIYVFVPLRIDNAIVGYMVMGHSKNAFADNKYGDFGGRLNRTLEKYQSSIRLARLNEKLSELMQKDSLTNVKNRIAYDNYMSRMDSVLSMSNDSQISVVMCDINNLKTINDNFGHDAGDVYIKNCCKLMCDSFKCSPIFRTGGDEFVIVISTADFPVRNERLAEMRAKMEEIAGSDCSPLACVSIATGISDFDPSKDKSLLDVVKRADAFMYVNKAEMKARALL